MSDVILWLKIILLFVVIIGLMIAMVGTPLYFLNRLQNKHFKLLADELGFTEIHLPRPALLTRYPFTRGTINGLHVRIEATTNRETYSKVPNISNTGKLVGILVVRMQARNLRYHQFKLVAIKRISNDQATHPHDLNFYDYFQVEADGQLLSTPLPENIEQTFYTFLATYGKGDCVILLDQYGYLLMPFYTQLTSAKKRKLVTDAIQLMSLLNG